ncbi:MAG: PQQ-binding-like beta-propeller repeat protein [Planctomycetales bacterium]|nr:PQQ-binding-like beta-propeller repeat protein [Planctomycetales bacterium]
MRRAKLSPWKTLQQRVRWLGFGLIALATAGMPQTGLAAELMGHETASKLGLHRAWFSHVQVDRANSRVTSWALHGKQLFALTSAGTIHAMDAETGETLWVSQVGRPNHPSAGPAINSRHVALMNGSTLYVLDRGDGHLIMSRTLGDIALAAPAMSESYVFVAQMSGRVEGFSLDDPFAAVWQYQSAGHVYQRPVAEGSFVTWTTDRGFLYFSDSSRPRVAFRVETNDDIVSAPSAKEDRLYASSLSGYLYCYASATGSELWRYPTGQPVTKAPKAVKDKVFVASEAPALHAADSASGRLLWTAAGVANFVAQGANHVYGTNRFGTLMILDNETGSLAGQIATGEGISALANDETDRIFLVSDRGLVQCIHEIGANEPTIYRSVPEESRIPDEGEKAEVESAAEEEPVDQPVSEEEPEFEEEPADDSNPFG